VRVQRHLSPRLAGRALRFRRRADSSLRARARSFVSRRGIIEAAVALGALLWLLTNAGLRALVWAGLRAMAGGARSGGVLSLRDPGTLGPALIALVKIALLLAPAIRMLARSPRYRLLWIPFGGAAFVVVLGNAVPGVIGVWMWLLLVAAAAVA